MSGLHRCLQRIFQKNTNYFYAVRISISLAILSEISFKLVAFSKSYARNNSGCFFLYMGCRKTVSLRYVPNLPLLYLITRCHIQYWPDLEILVRGR